jgi:hypothetical protein
MTLTSTAAARRRRTLAAGLFAACLLSTASAGEFALGISPPRLELELKDGANTRQVLEITNASAQASVLSIQTADWAMGPDNAPVFFDALQAGSCRPWVALERRELTVSAGRPYRFRFEIAPPAGTPPGECRFALLFEGQEQVTTGPTAVPFNARLGVMVYVAVGGATPMLSIAGSDVQNVNGRQTPVLRVTNKGMAHGRLAGFLSGTDAAGQSLEFSPDSLPILPGETRVIPLHPSRPGDPDNNAVAIRFPVTVSGKLEWGAGQAQTIAQRFAP